MAREQAESVAKRIRADVAAGHPFGFDEYAEGGQPQAFDALQWLEGVLDIEYRVSSDGEYKSAEVLIGFGGPNVWIDTKEQAVVCAWWSEAVSVSLPREFTDGLDEALEELWAMR